MELAELITWYKLEGASCQDITLLMERRAMLTAHSYNLATQSVNMLNVYLEAVADRKQFYAKFYGLRRKEGQTVKDAESNALIECADFYELEVKAESNYKHYKTQADQLNKICEVMGQQISVLRKERDFNQFTTSKQPS